MAARELVLILDFGAQYSQLIARRVREVLDLVSLDGKESRRPAQLSGGERQRVVIAIAIANDPDLLICDEPTTALDVTVQAQILEVLKTARDVTGAGVVIITHDLGVVAEFADRALVMYAGRAAEKAPKREVFYAPHHPYTKGLLESIPNSSAAFSPKRWDFSSSVSAGYW